MQGLSRVIAVLGARSGTSALAGTFGLLGCELPVKMMAANHANMKGYFEPQDLADLHDQILASLGSTWSDDREIARAWFLSQDAQRVKSMIVAVYIANYRKAPLAVIKEPRMCRLMPLWLQVFDGLRSVPAFCFIDRNPFAVARSLAARDGSTMEKGLRYYIRNHLDAERDTRWFRRSFLSYECLVSDWRSSIRRVSNELGIGLLPTLDQEGKIDALLDKKLNHQSPDREAGYGDIGRIALAIHDAYAGMAHGDRQAPIRDELDRIRSQFDNYMTH
jgi:hypothetical protein